MIEMLSSLATADPTGGGTEFFSATGEILGRIIRWTFFIFLVGYIFFWKQMRTLFNRCAGSDFMPENRLEQPQSLAALGGLLMLIYEFATDSIPKTSMPLPLQWFSLPAWCMLGFTFYVAVFYLRRRTRIEGRRLAFWRSLYLLLSCISFFALSGLAAAICIIAIGLTFILDKGGSFMIKSLHGSASSDGTPASSGKKMSCDHIRLYDGECQRLGARCPRLNGQRCPYGY